MPDTNGWGKELLDQLKRADRAKAGQVARQTREHATFLWQGLLARLYFTVLACNRVKHFQHALVLRAERVAGGAAGGGYIRGVQLVGHCKLSSYRSLPGGFAAALEFHYDRVTLCQVHQLHQFSMSKRLRARSN
jgi:hypothetical protein